MNEFMTSAPAHGPHVFRAARASLNKVGGRLAAWSARWRTRASLLSLSDGELEDIGISRAQAIFEYAHPSATNCDGHR